MAEKKLSRREFVTKVAAAAAISSLPTPVLAGSIRADAARSSTLQTQVALRDNPTWKDQGIENLTKSPHAKLRDIPVHAVTIQSGFWARRREVNVSRSIPTMHDLLEANGRMNNFLRLVGQGNAAQSGPVFSDSDVYN